MIEKLCYGHFQSENILIPLESGKGLIKTASFLEPAVEKFAERIKPEVGYIWFLVHALGAGEFYGSNRNGDYFSEAALRNIPGNWTGDPDLDKAIGKNWGWGYPTFYGAHIYLQHSNKDPAKSLGTVEFVHWNDKMKRVELVLKFDVNKAMEFGGDWILKRLDSNRLVDLSMGCFPPGTKISTTYGNFKNIENIQEKDLVLTHTGRIRGVDKVLPRKYNGDMHHLRIYGSSSLHLTPEHPLLVWNSMSNSASWVNTDKLVEGDLLCSPIPCDRESGYAVVNNGCRYITYPITKIDIDHYDGMVYNFSVKIDDSYVAESVAVHNCKVPFDIETVSADYDAYNRALATYDSKVHKSPAHAVLLYHKAHPIRGLSITKNDYTDLAKFSINKVFPDGRKVMLDNTFPRFFDISFVMIGAERPAKVLYKFASRCQIEGQKCAGLCHKGACEQFIPNGAAMFELEKNASAEEKKAAVKKVGDINKDIDSNFNPKSIGAEGKHFEDLPAKILNAMGEHPVKDSLSTSGLSGMILKPHEFQRIILIKIDKGDMADKLDEEGKVFPPTDEIDNSMGVSHDNFHSQIFDLLKSFLPMRSILTPPSDGAGKIKRIVISISAKPRTPVEDSEGVLKKISAAYNGYRKSLYENFEKEARLAIFQNSGIRNELAKYASLEDMIRVDTTPTSKRIFDLLRRF